MNFTPKIFYNFNPNYSKELFIDLYLWKKENSSAEFLIIAPDNLGFVYEI